MVWGSTVNCLRGRAIGISETAFYHLLFLVCFNLGSKSGCQERIATSV